MYTKPTQMQKKFFFLTPLIISCFSVLAQTSSLNRPFDPVIMSGSNLSFYIGAAPARIVGFKFTNGAWQQVPVQVDEKAVLDIVAPYGPYAKDKGYTPPPALMNCFIQMQTLLPVPIRTLFSMLMMNLFLWLRMPVENFQVLFSL